MDATTLPPRPALQLEPARPRHVAGLVDLRDACARWQVARGVTQWRPGEVGPDVVSAQVAAGEWHVLEHAPDGTDAPAGRPGEPRVVAAIRVLEQDLLVWPDGRPAGYLHGFMVDRGLSGRGLGAAVLRWAEGEVGRRGHDVVRLDCVWDNEVLRAYYRGQGYTERGVADRTPAGLLPCMRFEKHLPSA